MSCPIMTGKEIIIRIHVCLISWTYFNSKKNGGKKLFLPNESMNIVYPNDENVLMVPNKKKGKDSRMHDVSLHK